MEREGPRRIVMSICLGSSCFARGNAMNLQQLRELLRARGVLDRVELSGRLCCGECGDGPNLHVDGKVHRSVDAQAVAALVSGFFPEQAA